MRTTSPTRAAYNEALGLTVNQLLFERRMTRKELGEHFGIGQSVVSRKLRGQVSWTAEELSIMASLFGLTLDAFAPTRAADGSWTPAPYVPGTQKSPAPAGAGDSALVAGAGFEPATSGLRAVRALICTVEHVQLRLYYYCWRLSRTPAVETNASNAANASNDARRLAVITAKGA